MRYGVLTFEIDIVPIGCRLPSFRARAPVGDQLQMVVDVHSAVAVEVASALYAR